MSCDLASLRGRLEVIVGEANIHADEGSISSHAVDGVLPSMTVQPGSQDEVAAVVSACASAGAAMIPWGGGTAMATGNPPKRLDVVVCLERLDRIVEFDADNLCVTVEAGMPLGRLQQVVAERQELLPLDPPDSDRVTLGGLVAANQSGSCRLLHGTPRDWVLGMRVVLLDGERIRCGGRVIKNVSGYDMNKLFIRSFGTLGIITEVTLKLLPMPSARASVLGLFPGLPEASSVLEKIQASFLLPEALDLLWQRLGPRGGEARFTKAATEIRADLAHDAPVAMASGEREEIGRLAVLDVLRDVCERAPELKLDWYAVSLRRY